MLFFVSVQAIYGNSSSWLLHWSTFHARVRWYGYIPSSHIYMYVPCRRGTYIYARAKVLTVANKFYPCTYKVKRRLSVAYCTSTMYTFLVNFVSYRNTEFVDCTHATNHLELKKMFTLTNTMQYRWSICEKRCTVVRDASTKKMWFNSLEQHLTRSDSVILLTVNRAC